MSRKPKKRNKPYTGKDATPDKPTVHRYVAVERSPIGEWWQAHKKATKIVAIITAIVFVFAYLIFELFRQFF